MPTSSERRDGGVAFADCAGPALYATCGPGERFHRDTSGCAKSPKNADSARRFTWLVDVFYDDHVKLIVGAEALPDELFVDGGDAKTAAAEFQRTASRLTEMQSSQYLQLERTHSQ